MDTVAVIVTYNRKDLLKESIEALCGQTRPSDIMVVDNASTDGTEEMVREIMASMPEHSEHGKIIYHNMGENLGGAGGFSFGVFEYSCLLIASLARCRTHSTLH